MSFAIAEDLYQNVVAFHAANGMLDKDTDLTQGCIGSLVLLAQLWVGLLFTLARALIMVRATWTPSDLSLGSPWWTERCWR